MQATDGAGLTSYIGMASVGKDAAALPADDRRVGMFSWERRVQREDIKDGLSTTLMVVETTRDNGPWVAPGRPTTRGLDSADPPYIGVGGQFGSYHQLGSFGLGPRYGINIGMADGSVRTLSDSVSPSVIEALATIAGGEQVEPDVD